MLELDCVSSNISSQYTSISSFMDLTSIENIVQNSSGMIYFILWNCFENNIFLATKYKNLKRLQLNVSAKETKEVLEIISKGSKNLQIDLNIQVEYRMEQQEKEDWRRVYNQELIQEIGRIVNQMKK